MIELRIKEAEIDAMAGRIQRLGRDLRPAMQDVGEYLVRSTKQRFGEGKGPDGQAWEPNSDTTLARLSYGRAGGSVRKSGEKIRPKAVSGKRPLIGESKRLSTEIHYVATDTGVEVGSSLEYSATQQFGAKAGSFGRTSKGGPIPWGDIPARPFLGLSDRDKGQVLDILNEHLEEAMR